VSQIAIGIGRSKSRVKYTVYVRGSDDGFRGSGPINLGKVGMRAYHPLMTSRLIFLLSLALGSLIAIIPLVLKLRRDPFDAAGSYVIWWIGFFVLSTIMGFREPRHAKKVAQGVGLGLPKVLIGYFVVTPQSANLWPLALIVGTVVGMPPAFAGAYFGKFMTTTTSRWRRR
jgi:CDP-diglyceride synthetase